MFPGIHIGSYFLSSYAILAIVGIFTACPFAISKYKKRGGSDISMIFVFLFAAVGVFLGMHLVFGITNIKWWGKLFEAVDFLDFIKRFAAIFGGSVFYGGLLGGILAGWISIKVQKLPAALTADCAAPAIALFHFYGRLGCFLGGCCYGIESEHGITFTDSLVESANGVPRVPVQLYEAVLELAIFLVLWRLLDKGAFKGRLLSMYLLAYSVGRFILEFWRGDEYRGFLFGLSTSQLISIPVFLLSALYFIFAPKSKEDVINENAAG